LASSSLHVAYDRGIRRRTVHAMKHGMRRRRGPAKKLAPSMSPEFVCPHNYTEEEALQLEIDCGSCTGANDLVNDRCLTGVMNVIAAGAVPEAIILKRFIHKRYRGDAVRLAALVARELATLNRAIASAETPSDKKCRTCASSKELVMLAMKRRLLASPTKYMPGKGTDRSKLVEELTVVSCPMARKCIDEALAVSVLLSGVE
jgi:hypothetical protein